MVQLCAHRVYEVRELHAGGCCVRPVPRRGDEGRAGVVHVTAEGVAEVEEEAGDEDARDARRAVCSATFVR